jgi:hypothetical protein
MNHSRFLPKRGMLAGTAIIGCLLCYPRPVPAARASGGVPVLQVDASCPRPLPNKWALGQVSGIALGAQNHIWLLHRPGTLGADEKFAATNHGSVVPAWGGPGAGYDWPTAEHGLFVDTKVRSG